MSLTTCLHKATAIDPADKAWIIDRARALRGEGSETDAAARQAVAERLAEVQGLLNEAAPAAADPIAQRIADAEAAGVVLSDADKESIRAALEKADQLRGKAGGISRANDPMRDAFPLGGGFGRGSQRSRDRKIDASVKRAGEAVAAFTKADQAQQYADNLLAGKGTEADMARKAAKKLETQRLLVQKLLAWQKGDQIGGVTIERVNKDADGYPATYTISGDGIIKGVGDKVDVAREFFDRDKDAFRAMVDEVRGRKDPLLSVVRDEPQTETEAFKRWSNDAPLITSGRAAAHEFKTGQKVVVEAFHGTKRPDRVGNIFQRKRATSGPMAFFTASPTLASNYAQNKSDTSLANEDQNYENWFKYKPKGERTPVDIVRAWYRLTPEQKDTVAALAPRVMFSDEQEADGGNKIVLGPEDHKSGTGSYDYNLKVTQRGYDKRGNPLKALVEDWLNSANLFNDEERFIQVLKLAGFPVSDVTMDSPHAEYPFVYKTFVFMQQPLVTSDVPQEVRSALTQAARRDRSRTQPGGDTWDKNNRTLREWVQTFESADSEYVWTSIPDKVTDVLKSLGYDGIIDRSGKAGGENAIVEPVYIPFEETQVKSAIGNKGTFNRDKKNILLSVDRGPAFYSELAKQIERANMNVGPAASWKALIKGLTQRGVKPDEIEWTGINEWLDMQESQHGAMLRRYGPDDFDVKGKGKITKQQVLDFLNANGVRVEETTLGGRAPWLERLDMLETRGRANLTPAEAAEMDELREDRDTFGGDPRPESEQAKFGTYTLPGGTNYREVLLTLPARESLEFQRAKERYARAVEAEKKVGSLEAANRGDLTDETDQAQQAVNRLRQQFESGRFKSGHWDQPNIVAHIRLDDRTDSEGKRVLFVEEIQSDFGQAHKKQRDAINKAVDNDFNAIIERMKKAGVLKVECD